MKEEISSSIRNSLVVTVQEPSRNRLSILKIQSLIVHKPCPKEGGIIPKTWDPIKNYHNLLLHQIYMTSNTGATYRRSWRRPCSPPIRINICNYSNSTRPSRMASPSINLLLMLKKISNWTVHGRGIWIWSRMINNRPTGARTWEKRS